MGSRQTNPLTVEQAKQRLRDLAQVPSPGGWIRAHPWDALSIAFAAGLLAGADPRARGPLAEALAKVLAEGITGAAMGQEPGP